MKKIYTLATASMAALVFVGCTSATPPKKNTTLDIAKLDVTKVCSIKENGLKQVLATAKTYNKIAVKHQVEFMRFGASTTAYIKGIDAAIKSGSSTANVKQKKKVVKFDINYATTRACKFALSALQQEIEAKSTWRLAVPGDGFKY